MTSSTGPHDASQATTAPAARRDASMTLLTEMMDRPLDPGYAAAAERRRYAGLPPRHSERSPTSLLLLLALGVLLAAAALQVRGTSTARVAERDELAAEITRQDAAATQLQAANVALAARIDAERARRLQAASQTPLADEITRLGLLTGALPTSGPGVTVTVDDAPALTSVDGSDPRADSAAEDGRVLDQDLQSVVNGLWAAGAEAVAVNGQRLTALSAIRSAGEAILVDYRPLAPPYRVLAVGDPATLTARFTGGAAGRELKYLADNFGVRYDLVSADRLSLPGSAGLGVRRAQPVPGPGASAGSVPSGSPSTVPSATATTSQEERP